MRSMITLSLLLRENSRNLANLIAFRNRSKIDALELELAQLEKLVRTSEGRDFAASETAEEISDWLRDFRTHRRLDDSQWHDFLIERIRCAKEKLQKKSPKQMVRAQGALDVEFTPLTSPSGRRKSLRREDHSLGILKAKVQSLAVDWQLRKLQYHIRTRE